jgi:hypothetical protein
MAKEWVMVRLTRETHAALERIRSSMEVAEEMQLVQLERDHTSHVSLNQVIERLIAMREAHAERRQRSNAARRRKPAAAAELPAEDLAGAAPPAAPPPGPIS